MKKILLAALTFSLMTISCKKDTEMLNDDTNIDSTTVEDTVDMHNAMNSLDYQGTYLGSLPCADCESIETKILLTDDSFVKETVYKGKSKEVFKES